MATQEIKINQALIDSINSVSEHYIVAYDNNYSLFQVVFYVLKSVVPLSEKDAYEKTMEIHLTGSSVVYSGSLSHCLKIQDALDKIKVKSEIFECN